MEFEVSVTLNPIVDYDGGEMMASDNWTTFESADAVAYVPASFTKKNAYVLDLAVVSSPDTSYGFTLVSNPVMVYPVSEFCNSKLLIIFLSDLKMHPKHLQSTLYVYCLHYLGPNYMGVADQQCKNFCSEARCQASNTSSAPGLAAYQRLNPSL